MCNLRLFCPWQVAAVGRRLCTFLHGEPRRSQCLPSTGHLQYVCMGVVGIKSLLVDGYETQINDLLDNTTELWDTSLGSVWILVYVAGMVSYSYLLISLAA